jgi:hypothetical protein
MVDRRGPGTWCLAVCKSLNLRPVAGDRGVAAQIENLVSVVQ